MDASDGAEIGGFKRRLMAGEPLIGTFIKTPTGHATEILGGVGFDFVIVDEEHAPFDRRTTDEVMVAARASGIAALVRVASSQSWHIQAALDCGAAGVVVPHVTDAAGAREVVACCRYRGGRRGFSTTPRAGGYGAARAWDHVASQDAAVTVVAMIEDATALDRLDEIAAVDGIDCLFVGRGDLMISMGQPAQDGAELEDAVLRIMAAAQKAGKPVCVMVGAIDETRNFLDRGATVFVLLSDQGLMRQTAVRSKNEFSRFAASRRPESPEPGEPNQNGMERRIPR